MFSNQIEISYQQILSLRREDRFQKNIPNILKYQQTENGYILSFDNFFCEISGDDLAHFNANIKVFCNRNDIPTGRSLRTHDYSNRTSWINGTNNSVYCFSPPQGKEFVLHEVKSRANKGLSFSSEQSLNISVWKSTTQPCPDYASQITEFNNSAYSLGNGWLKTYPESDTIQEVSVYKFYQNNVELYKVVNFKFESIDDMKDKSRVRIDENTYRFTNPYTEYGTFLNLRSSLKERIECYTSNNQPLSLPMLTSDKSLITIIFREYNEF